MTRHIDFDGIDNFRDFGGYATACGRGVKAGQLFRSANHHRATDADLQRLRDLGVAVMGLGGGRRTESGSIDHAVGLTRIAAVAARVGPDAPLAVIHARDEDAWEEAAAAVREAMAVAGEGEPGPEAPAL